MIISSPVAFSLVCTDAGEYKTRPSCQLKQTFWRNPKGPSSSPHAGNGLNLSCRQVVVSGKGSHLGEDVAWQLRWRGDGAFTEQIKGRHLCFRWGFEGGDAGTTWEVQSSHLL